MTTLVVDGTNLVMRSMHATGGVELSSEDGDPTAATFVFIKMLSKYVRTIRPTHLAVAFDLGRSEYRAGIWREYKAHRTDAPEVEHKRSTFALVREFLSSAGILHLCIRGVEADDIISAWWWQRDVTQSFVMLSGDKDFLQLVGGNSVLVRPGTGHSVSQETWDDKRVIGELGLRPEHLPLAKAMCGDPSDGIPNVPRVGLKTAVKIGDRNGWYMDQVLADLKVKGYAEQIKRNLKLVDLRRPLWHHFAVQDPPEFTPALDDMARGLLLDYLRRLSMATIIDQVLDGTLWSDVVPSQ